MVRPATPGTVVVLVAAIVLLIVSLSTPVIKSIDFLAADLSVSLASVTIDGTVKLGVLGYCVEGIGTKPVCQGPQVGYELDSDQVFGNTTSFNLPNSLIKWLTYALVIHPIAAGLAAISFISGCISHCRQFSRSRLTTCITTFATIISLIAFVFDIVLFSIAKSRINAASNRDVALDAKLGNGIWLTLVGFILLLVSGCFFGFGHCCMNRRPTEAQKNSARPQMDAAYASDARKDADDLEKAEKKRRAAGGSSGLPAFPEEEVPLTSMPKTEELYSEESTTSQDIAGVGTGYGRRAGQQTERPPVRHGSQSGNNDQYQAVHEPPYNPNYNGRSAYGNTTDYGPAEPFVSMYDTPSRQSTPGYDQRSRARQASEPASASSATNFMPRRQTSAATAAGYNQQPSRYGDPPPPVFPTPIQHGGQDPAEFVASGVLHTPYPTYPPQVAAYAQQDYLPPSAPGGSGNTYHRATASAPWLPEPTDAHSSTLLQQGDSFHAAAAAARHRQSQSMGDGAYAGNQTYNQTELSAPHQRSHHPYDNSMVYTQAQRSQVPVTYSAHHHPSSSATASQQQQTALSPTGDIYDAYYNESPHQAGPPAAIPFVPDPGQTPSPSCHSAEPYPSYGGNTYR